MSRLRIPPSAQALPYKPSAVPSRTRPTPPLPPTRPPRRYGIYIASSIFAFAISAYSASLYINLTATPDPNIPLPHPSTDVSSRYNTLAPHYDTDVSFDEWIFGINRLRRRLIKQAKGDVLEVCAGTGRNAAYYDLEMVKSLNFVDQSAPMVEIARKKWETLYPHYKPAAFHTQSMTDPLPVHSPPKEGFTTIIQTMGICSTPSPSTTLAQLGQMAHPRDGRVLLLEHGRSYYSWLNWVLDKSAARHADKYGCWFNRDVGEVLEKSGLVLEKVERSQFGTVWFVEARPPTRGEVDEGKGAREGHEIKGGVSPETLQREKTANGWFGWGKD